MPKICFEFSGHKFWYSDAELLHKLRAINKYEKSKHQQDIQKIIQKWPNITKEANGYFAFSDDYYYFLIKELLFFYSIREEMLSNKAWIALDVPTLSDAQKQILKDRAKAYGEYRYDVDNGWLGVLAQDLFRDFMGNHGFDYEEYEIDSSGNTDDFDLLINNIKIDVKCATQSNYVEITPKILAELEKKKDYYVALKYFDNNKKVIILGYFDHSDLGLYPFKVLYGTPYWGVKLFSAKPFSDLLGILENE